MGAQNMICKRCNKSSVYCDKDGYWHCNNRDCFAWYNHIKKVIQAEEKNDL